MHPALPLLCYGCSCWCFCPQVLQVLSEAEALLLQDSTLPVIVARLQQHPSPALSAAATTLSAAWSRPRGAKAAAGAVVSPAKGSKVGARQQQQQQQLKQQQQPPQQPPTPTGLAPAYASALLALAERYRKAATAAGVAAAALGVAKQEAGAATGKRTFAEMQSVSLPTADAAQTTGSPTAAAAAKADQAPAAAAGTTAATTAAAVPSSAEVRDGNAVTDPASQAASAALGLKVPAGAAAVTPTAAAAETTAPNKKQRTGSSDAGKTPVPNGKQPATNQQQSKQQSPQLKHQQQQQKGKAAQKLTVQLPSSPMQRAHQQQQQQQQERERPPAFALTDASRLWVLQERPQPDASYLRDAAERTRTDATVIQREVQVSVRLLTTSA